MLFDTLPDEITLRILQFLTTTQDVVAVKRTNKEGKKLGMDATLWLEPLKQDFYFTESTTKETCLRLKKNYVQLYQYCTEYKFNDAQTKALKQLESNGLKPEHLKGRNWFDDDHHKDALIYLMTERQPSMNAIQAMVEIDNLSWMQANGISNGLSRHEVTELSNLMQCSTLVALKSKGLKSEHLKNQDWFNHYQHQEALIYLMTKRQPPMNAEQAMAEIDNLSWIHANGISNGLSRHEVTELFNWEQISALIALKSKGLKSEHLKNQDWFNYTCHKAALIYLMTERQPSINATQAMAEIDKLSFEQAYGISKGLSRKEVTELSNLIQFSTLVELKSKGLKTEHLKGQDWFNDYQHQEALIYLMTKRQPPMNAEQAMAEIKELSPEQALSISQGLSRKEIIEQHDDFCWIDNSDKNENPVLANTNSYKPIFAPANAALEQANQLANSVKHKIDELKDFVNSYFSTTNKK